MNIDWSKLITKEMKDAKALEQTLANSKRELSDLNAFATSQINRIQDRITTIGYLVELGENTSDDDDELERLTTVRLDWIRYKTALGKVTKAVGWPTSPAWPVRPPIPDIEADPAMSLMMI